MYRERSLGVVVPAYNEERHVGTVIDTLPSFVDRAYVVDDRSTDGTWAEIAAHADETVTGADVRPASDRSWPGASDESNGGPHVVGIRQPNNRGRGAAVALGYRYALAEELDVVAVMDGDGQMDPAILDRIVDPVATGVADYSKGNRLSDREHWRGMTRWRLFGNFCLTYLTRAASGYWTMKDPQNGYTAISADALRTLDLDSLYEGYGFLNDVLVKLNVRNARVANVPMPAVYGDEESTIRYSTFIPSVSALLLSNFLWRVGVGYVVSDFYPLVVLYAVGVLGLLAGVGYALGSAVASVPASSAPTLAGVLIAGLITTLVAVALDWRYNAPLEVFVSSLPEEAGP